MNVSADHQATECLIVGAGLAGLVAGSRLVKAGVTVTVIEQEANPGGRMIAVTLDGDPGTKAVFDAGAQFFTVRESAFESTVSDWLDRGLVEIWSHGFATGDGSFYADGHPRYRGIPDMGAIALDLAQGLDVRYGHAVEKLYFEEDRWLIRLTSGVSHRAKAVILTPPVPKSMALLSKAGTHLKQFDSRNLGHIHYEPCIALMVLLDGPGNIPEPGGLWPIDSPISWMADNFRKGVSPVIGAITIHAAPEFSRGFWNEEDPVIVERLVTAAHQWLDADIITTMVYRWFYSKPEWLYPNPCLAIADPAPLIFAGDAFAGPRVEGAALSGLAAAEWLLNL